MNDIDTVFMKCKDAYFHGWIDKELAVCQEILPRLSIEHLRMLNQSRWMSKKSPLYPLLFSLLYKEQIEGIVKKLNELTTDDLLKELKVSRSSFKRDKIAQILYERYDSMNEEERKKVFSILVRRGLIIKTED